MAKGKTIMHERDCDDCRDLEKENKFIATYREFFKEDMREVVREEWNEHVDNTNRIDSHDRWLGKVTIEKITIYIIPLLSVATFLYLLFKDFILKK